MVQKLRDESRTYLARSMEGAREERPENYIVRHLMDMPAVDYDSQSELLFKLSIVDHHLFLPLVMRTQGFFRLMGAPTALTKLSQRALQALA
jgi:hypothetical protein